jgi:amidase
LLIFKGNDDQKLLEAARDCLTSREEYNRNLKALREKGSSSIQSVLFEYDVDVIVGPCDSFAGMAGAASDFPVANLPLGFADFNGRGFSLHMLAPKYEEAKMFRIMAAWEATFPDNVRPPPALLDM